MLTGQQRLAASQHARPRAWVRAWSQIRSPALSGATHRRPLSASLRGQVCPRPLVDDAAQYSKACDAIARPPLRKPPLPRLMPLPTVSRPPTSCLSFCLIHLRPQLFTGGRHERIRPVHGRWRTPANADQHYWKACWGQPLRSSNLLSSATLTCKNTGGDRSQAGSLCQVGSFNGLICSAARPAAGDISRCDGPGQRHHGQP